jgi:hypothetical protein
MLLNQWLNGLFVLFVFFDSPYVFAASVLPVAFVSPWLNSVIVGYRTAVTPDHLIGRVSSVARNLAFLGMPLGPLAAGLLLGNLTARTSVIVLAAMCVGLAAFSTLSPSIRKPPSLAELDELPAPVVA